MLNKYKFLLTISFALLFQHVLYAQNYWQLLGLEEFTIEYVYAKGDTIWTTTMDTLTRQRSIYYSFNSGITWTKVDDTDSLINGSIFLLNVSSYDILTLYSIGYKGRGLKSSDGGESWENMFAFLEPWPNGRYVRKVYISPFNENIIFSIIASGPWESLVRTTDGGETWEDVSAFVVSNHGSKLAFAFDPIDSATIYVAGDDYLDHTAFYPSYDLGETWYFLPNSISTERIFVDWNDNNRIYLFARPMVSEDGGMIWTDKVEGLPFGVNWSSFLLDPTNSNILYMLTGAGLYRTINKAEQWNLIPGSENLDLSFASGSYYDNIFVDSSTNKLYVGTKQGLYKYDLLTSVEEEKENIPEEFILHQNYPNPFNPTTAIKYSISTLVSEGRVRVLLKVYDILGKEVATLVNKEQAPGTYEVKFNGEGLPSGIYLYRLTAGQVSIVRKMLLLK